MTNHWADIDNSSLIVVMGANPTENHPACMAHVNAARYGSKKARLIVIDPRKTRTAQQADLFVRIRPGTDIAFLNGMLNYIMSGISNGTVDATFANNLVAWHNSTATNSGSFGRAFTDDSGNSRTLGKFALQNATNPPAYDGVATTALNNGWPKYCDSRLKVVAGAAPTDYQRGTLTVTNPALGPDPQATWTFSNVPVVADSIFDADSVYSKLKKHVEPYTLAVSADICGCAQADIIAVADELIANSRFKSSDFGAEVCNVSSPTYKAATVLYAMGQTQHTYGSQNIKDLAVVQTLLGNMGRPGGGINALRGIHNVQGSTDMGLLYDGLPGYYSANPATYTNTADPLADAATAFESYMNTMFGNRVKNGTLPVTSGKKNVFDPQALGLQQRGFYNMTRAWFGSTASTFDRTATLKKVRLAATGAVALPNTALVSGSVSVFSDSAGTIPVAATEYTLDLTKGTIARTATSAIADNTDVWVTYTYTTLGYSDDDLKRLYALWPKGNGLQHITAFREMAAGNIKAAVVWGQNPAVTEPNQTAVREGLKKLDLLVCVDMFATETVECTRKSAADIGGDGKDGVTYLLPACSHVEEAGSVTNSGRWIQWRDRARAPYGNSKADVELLLRLAKALDTANGFAHIKSQWAGMTDAPDGVTHTTSVYDVLFGAGRYGWDGVVDFEGMTGSSIDGAAIVGSEIVTEKIFKEHAQPLASGGTLWIYSEAYNPTKTSARPAAFGTPVAITAQAVTLNGFALVDVDATLGAFSGTVEVWTDAAKLGTKLIENKDYTLDKAAGKIAWNTNSTVSGNAIASNATVYVWVPAARPRVAWTVVNRAKSRMGNALTDAGEVSAYPRYGYAWLFNRRVFYNNSEVPGDEPDSFVAPGHLARLFTVGSNTLADWTSGVSYRAYNTFKDRPTKGRDTTADQSDATAPHKFAGRFPGHTEPIETPRRDLANLWGRNENATDNIALLKGDTKAAIWGATETYTDPRYTGNAGFWDKDASAYPLVLTTIRCVEHFQGGPITRNNTWNVEAEPVPWIEINSADARTYGINDGDWVNVITARSNSTTQEEARSNGTGWAKGFKARVGVGLSGNQRVAPGVVAIPWHWGDKGLATGSRANDLCIDSFDANTTIPEYKACLCRITKVVSDVPA